MLLDISVELTLKLTMNNKFLTVIMAFVISFSCLSAEAAKRLGSGNSVGHQSNNVADARRFKTHTKCHSRHPFCFASSRFTINHLKILVIPQH
jgi:hypothetical protein